MNPVRNSRLPDAGRLAIKPRRNDSKMQPAIEQRAIISNGVNHENRAQRG